MTFEYNIWQCIIAVVGGFNVFVCLLLAISGIVVTIRYELKRPGDIAVDSRNALVGGFVLLTLTPVLALITSLMIGWAA